MRAVSARPPQHREQRVVQHRPNPPIWRFWFGSQLRRANLGALENTADFSANSKDAPAISLIER